METKGESLVKFYRVHSDESFGLCIPRDKWSIMGWSLAESISADLKEPLVFDSEESLPILDFYPCFGGALLVSEALLALFEKLKLTGKVYSAQLCFTNGELRDLFAFHLQEKELCVNRSHSDFDKNPVEPDQIERLNKLVIEPSSLKGKTLFRVQEYREWIIASDSFKETWDKSAFTGCLFEPLEHSWEKN